MSSYLLNSKIMFCVDLSESTSKHCLFELTKGRSSVPPRDIRATAALLQSWQRLLGDEQRPSTAAGTAVDVVTPQTQREGETAVVNASLCIWQREKTEKWSRNGQIKFLTHNKTKVLFFLSCVWIYNTLWKASGGKMKKCSVRPSEEASTL